MSKVISSAKILKVLSKIFPNQKVHFPFSFRMMLWYGQKIGILLLLKKRNKFEKIRRLFLHFFLQRMCYNTQKLGHYAGSSISSDEAYSLCYYVSLCCSKAQHPEKAIPLLQTYTAQHLTHMTARHRLATLFFWMGNVEGVKAAYGDYTLQRTKIAQKVGFDLEKYRCFASTFTSAIGHICILGFYAMLRILEGPESKINLLYLDRSRVVNNCLLSYFLPLYEVIESSEAKIDYALLEEPWLMMEKKSGWEYFYDGCIQIIQQWEREKRAPLLTLKEEDIEHGWEQLAQFGIPRGAWFVTLHIRDAKSGEVRHASIDEYLLAIQCIVDAGGWVIRMGDKTMPRLPPLAQVIDYAHSSVKSDRMDVFLIGACKFFLGTNSGPAFAPGFFGKRCLQTNYAPFMYNIPYSRDMLLPILFRSKKTKKILPFAEMLASPLIHAEYPTSVPHYDVEIVPNSPEQLYFAVREMLDIVDAPEDFSLKNHPLQLQFQSLCHQSRVICQPMISTHFLQSHQDLLS